MVRIATSKRKGHLLTEITSRRYLVLGQKPLRKGGESNAIYHKRRSKERLLVTRCDQKGEKYVQTSAGNGFEPYAARFLAVQS